MHVNPLQIEAVLGSGILKSLLEITSKKNHPLYPAARKTLGRIGEIVKNYSNPELKLFLLKLLLKANAQFDIATNSQAVATIVSTLSTSAVVSWCALLKENIMAAGELTTR